VDDESTQVQKQMDQPKPEPPVENRVSTYIFKPFVLHLLHSFSFVTTVHNIFEYLK
jgi:hypothetical protein